MREHHDRRVYERIAARVEKILDEVREREENGQTLAIDINARFRLLDVGAVQFLLASAILEELAGLRQEEVVTELLTLGLAAVLQGAAKAASHNGVESPFPSGVSEGIIPSDGETGKDFTTPHPGMFATRGNTLN